MEQFVLEENIGLIPNAMNSLHTPFPLGKMQMLLAKVMEETLLLSMIRAQTTSLQASLTILFGLGAMRKRKVTGGGLMVLMGL